MELEVLFREHKLLKEAMQSVLLALGMIEDTEVSTEELLMVAAALTDKEEAHVLDQWKLRRELINKTRSGELEWSEHERYPDIYVCSLEPPYRLRLIEEGGDLLQLDDADYPHGNSETVFVYAGDKLLKIVKQSMEGKYPNIVDKVRTMI